MEKDMIAVDHGTEKIDLSGKKEHLLVLLPKEIHLKHDGAKNGTPSIAIVMTRPDSPIGAVGEVSLEMLNDCLADIGYEIKKKT